MQNNKLYLKSTYYKFKFVKDLLKQFKIKFIVLSFKKHIVLVLDYTFGYTWLGEEFLGKRN